MHDKNPRHKHKKTHLLLAMVIIYVLHVNVRTLSLVSNEYMHL